MNAGDLTVYWLKYFGGPPQFHLLRSTCKDRWFRIHALPESKRYPESLDEWATVLSRHNEMLSELLAAESEVLLLTTTFSHENMAPFQDALLSDGRAWFWTTSEDKEAGVFLYIYARQLQW